MAYSKYYILIILTKSHENIVTDCQGNRIPGNINPLLRNVNAKHYYIHGNG
jgi:hypothetical protein